MLKFLLSLILIFISVSHASARELVDEPGQVIRVGVFPNPPVAFLSNDGSWRGISIDILQAIAADKGWILKFVPGSFHKQLAALENDQIDLISMMAFSEGRAKNYMFTDNYIISNWGLVYSKPDTKVNSILELNGKRVGVMRNNIHDKAFRKLAKKFALNIEIVPLDNFSDVMKNVQSGKVDAGVANRLFGVLNADKYGLVQTGIIFNPINIHYSTLATNQRVIIDAIDKQLGLYKNKKDSVYFTTLDHWLHQSADTKLPAWLVYLAIALVSIIVLMVGITLLLRRQVAARTHELQLEVDERRQTDRLLDELAYFDSLTKLPNRVSLLDNLRISIASAKRRNKKVAVLFIDIDRFKTVNDSLGHDAGDQLIIHVAKRLQTCLRGEDTINRFGGDEFVAVLHDIDDLSYIDHITERMLKCLSLPINIGITEIYTSICIGVAVYPDDDASGEHLLKYADAAMYHAKEQGGNNFQFYNIELTRQVQKRLDMETRLRHALERNEFRLYYQPILDLKNNKPVAVEALIRWQDPDHGLIYPDDFIPLAEESGLIVLIGDWVIDEGFRQVREWETQGLGQLELAINVSSHQFDHKRLYTKVISALKDSKLKPEQLELEITERMFLNISKDVQESLDLLTKEGVRFSIDDFGTGYSSLSYLKRLPINTLKVDRSFVTGIPEDKDDMQITTTIVSMAHGLRMNVVAEGIETEEQLLFLKTLDCSRGQGYYLCEPKSAEEMTTWLQEN